MINRVLEIGCGGIHHADVTDCIDIRDNNCKGVKSVIADINKRLPYKNNTFNKVYMFQVIEHVKDAIKLMKEVNRITKKDGLCVIETPHVNSTTAWGSIEHVRAFSMSAFDTSNGYRYELPGWKTVSLKFKPIRRAGVIGSFISNLLGYRIAELFPLLQVSSNIRVVLKKVV